MTKENNGVEICLHKVMMDDRFPDAHILMIKVVYLHRSFPEKYWTFNLCHVTADQSAVEVNLYYFFVLPHFDCPLLLFLLIRYISKKPTKR